jgi:NADP-dependent 3-hydroxy acid dehydrogenase YdfG
MSMLVNSGTSRVVGAEIIQDGRTGLAGSQAPVAGSCAAVARRLVTKVFSVVMGTRREDRQRPLAGEKGARAVPLDMTDPTSAAAFDAAGPNALVLINCVGRVLGPGWGEQADADEWRRR